MVKRKFSKIIGGFTLLEIIIVIIIVGVLASLALPRFFNLIEFSRSTEALTNIGAIRQAMERCYLMNNGKYGPCTKSKLDIDDPDTSPNAHFTYDASGGDLVGGGVYIGLPYKQRVIRGMQETGAVTLH